MQTGSCGKATIKYDEVQCSFTCDCLKGGLCYWAVTCGKYTVSGFGLVTHPHKITSVTVAGGTLAMCAINLQKLWNRTVLVPPKLRAVRVGKRTLKGGPEEVAKALGFKLGPKRKGRSKHRK